MRILSLTVILEMLLFACSQKEKKTELPKQKLEYYYVNYDIDCCTMVEFKQQSVQYSSHVKDNVYSLTYIYEGEHTYDTVTYILKEAERFQSKYISKGNQMPDKMFPMVNSVSLLTYGHSQLKRKEYKVYKYAANGANIDGCMSHFWVPELGSILKRNTWRSFQKLRTNNDSINRQIELLTDIIYQDQDFYKGCDFELPD